MGGGGGGGGGWETDHFPAVVPPYVTMCLFNLNGLTMRENSFVNHGLTRYTIISCPGGIFCDNRQWSQFSVFFNIFI